MGYGRKAIVEGVYDPRDRRGFGPALEHLSEYLNLNIRGLESVVRGHGVLGQTKRKKGVVVEISAHFSDGQRNGKAIMNYFVVSRDGEKSKRKIEEIWSIFKKYSGPFTGRDSTTPTSSS